jgi:DNA-binding IclR family transcriptional regulator
VNKDINGKRGVQSFDIGMNIFKILLNENRSMKLKEIAEVAEMPDPKVHRYIVSMVRSGLVKQNEDNLKYELGPLAMRMGLIAMNQIDRIQAGLDVITQLCSEIEETTALSTWSNDGPIVIRWVRPKKMVSISVTTGTSLPMITTASGRVFGAFLSSETYAHLIEKELKSSKVPTKYNSKDAIDRLFEQTRQQGFAAIKETHEADGVTSVGAPVFKADGKITLVIAIVGLRGVLDLNPDGQVIQSLLKATSSLSKVLGFLGS